MVLTLDNLARKYDPSWKISPYAPYVRPRQMVRVRARLGTVTIPLFLGLSEGSKLGVPERWVRRDRDDDSQRRVQTPGALRAVDGAVGDARGAIDRPREPRA